MEILISLPLFVIAYIFWQSYRKDAKRVKNTKEQLELLDKIQSRIRIVNRDLERLIIEYNNTGIYDQHANELIQEEQQEINKMIYEYNRKKRETI